MACLCCSTDAPVVEKIDNSLTDEKVAMPMGKSEVLSSASAFKVTLLKPVQDTPLGLHLDLSDNVMVHICGVRQGVSPVVEYNGKASQDLQILPGDYIISVNGVNNDSKRMVEELAKERSLDLEVRHPVTSTVTINRQGGAMGLDLNYAKMGKSLVIDGIAEGAVMTWNKQNPAAMVKKGDRIVAVNGVSGSPSELLENITQSSTVELTMSRPSQ
mmetsp:Transcript_19572/g.58684  ORF Transcript_19572/g.58684 Transcript_19572/m.58684 type:complete len:215 (+) Transcript_19572:82-726(+)